jgi:hypothetical protein
MLHEIDSSSMSDDREVNFESYGENNDVEYDK